MLSLIRAWVDDRATRKQLKVLDRKFATLSREHYRLCQDHEELFQRLQRLEECHGLSHISDTQTASYGKG